jgi:hypothetical protein
MFGQPSAWDNDAEKDSNDDDEMTMMTMMSMRSGTLITTKLMQHRSKNGKCEMP